MKKISLIMILTFISISLYTQEVGELNLGDKTVIGKDKRQYNKEKQLFISPSDIDISKDKIETKYDDSLLLDEPNLDDIKFGKGFGQDISENALLEHGPKIVVRSDEKTFGNYIVFGTGGYDKIDAFSYIIDYRGEEESDDFDYYLHLGRQISGEKRNNSSRNIDNFFGRINYTKHSIGISHTINEKKFPGIKSSIFPVLSSAKLTETELSAWYDLFENNKGTMQSESFVIFAKTYSAEQNSMSPLRAYQNNYYNIYGVYDNFFDIRGTNNFTSLELGYLFDSVPNNKLSSLRIVGNDKIKLKDDNTLDFDVKGGIDLSKRESNNKSHYIIEARANKIVNDEFSGSIGLKKSTMPQQYKEILNAFIFDDDILAPITQLKDEDNLVLDISCDYDKEDLYAGITLRQVSTKEKITYEENFLAIANEVPISLANYTGNINWTEIEINGSYTYKDIRGELDYTYSTLNKIAFSPQNNLKMGLVYEQEKYKVELLGKYFSDMYGNSNKINKIEGYMSFDINSVYRLNDLTSIGFNIENIFDNKKDYKTFYPGKGRKLSLNMKLNY